MSRPVRRHRPCPAALAALGVVAALTLAGCNSDSDEPKGGSDPTGSSSTSTSSSESPSESASPTVTPAKGPLLALKRVTVNAPDGWKRGKDLVAFEKHAGDGSFSGISVNDIPATDLTLSLAERAADYAKNGGFVRKPKVRGTVDVNGVECWRVAGKVDATSHQETYGTIHDNAAVTISMNFYDTDYSAAERQEVVASVLASVNWL